jgi:hypothetical protein
VIGGNFKNCLTTGCENGYDGTGADRVEEWKCVCCNYTYCLKCEVFIKKPKVDSNNEFESNHIHPEVGSCEEYQQKKL